MDECFDIADFKAMSKYVHNLRMRTNPNVNDGIDTGQYFV